ncbi:dipeptide epimerase [Ktedonosporobacter rubrisoli]|uniref:Dipeptide epimerase n=1 Tax=Ktedonosporobacter rubrisoli TaxID=2509675 RepID=A0A4P6JYJ3_KTERU|nr:dipeptide epimerase [Ktedonosporobacter rubrisoli]QBD80774.1 dipeptide epimerase [Ktedonosporobacter rubrisoli]
MSRTTIKAVSVEPLNIPFPEPFNVATGSMAEARNVLITIKLEDGSVGYGESAPFPPSTGETQETALAAAQGCIQLLEGKDAANWRALSKLILSVFYSQRTVCAAAEMAMLDALTRSYGIPLYVFFGGASSSVETDMSIGMASPEHAYELAKEAIARGMTRIKIKVGGKLEDDIARVEAIHKAGPHVGLTLDANQGYTPAEALMCLDELIGRKIRPLMLEQPVHKYDYEGLRYVTQHTTVPVAADESAANSAEVAHLLAMEAVNVINIKLQKCGIVDALEIAALCRVKHIPLMIGAMADSRLATSASAHFVAGLGGFSYIDLDSPMLMVSDPFTGGYEQKGAIYDLAGIKSGLGIERKP